MQSTLYGTWTGSLRNLLFSWGAENDGPVIALPVNDGPNGMV